MDQTSRKNKGRGCREDKGMRTDSLRMAVGDNLSLKVKGRCVSALGPCPGHLS